MGLLLGETAVDVHEIGCCLLIRVQKTPRGLECHIWSICVFPRAVRESDRVEIAPEHLVAATTEAEV